MISLTKYLSASISGGIRKLKVIVSGKNNVQEPTECMPFGIDSVPIENMTAIYAPSTIQGSNVIIGYVNKNQLAATGEFRAYSTDSSGALVTYIWLHNTAGAGQIELGGTADNAMRYTQFNTVMQNYLTLQNTAIQAGIASAGGSYTAPPAPDFTAAKIDEIKTP
jgi:hypothetical protein